MIRTRGERERGGGEGGRGRERKRENNGRERGQEERERGRKASSWWIVRWGPRLMKLSVEDVYRWGLPACGPFTATAAGLVKSCFTSQPECAKRPGRRRKRRRRRGRERERERERGVMGHIGISERMSVVTYTTSDLALSHEQIVPTTCVNRPVSRTCDIFKGLASRSFRDKQRAAFVQDVLDAIDAEM